MKNIYISKYIPTHKSTVKPDKSILKAIIYEFDVNNSRLAYLFQKTFPMGKITITIVQNLLTFKIMFPFVTAVKAFIAFR